MRLFAFSKQLTISILAPLLLISFDVFVALGFSLRCLAFFFVFDANVRCQQLNRRESLMAILAVEPNDGLCRELVTFDGTIATNLVRSGLVVAKHSLGYDFFGVLELPVASGDIAL